MRRQRNIAQTKNKTNSRKKIPNETKISKLLNTGFKVTKMLTESRRRTRWEQEGIKQWLSVKRQKFMTKDWMVLQSRVSALLILFNTALEVLVRATGEEKEIIGIQIRNRVILFLCSWTISSYMQKTLKIPQTYIHTKTQLE